MCRLRAARPVSLAAPILLAACLDTGAPEGFARLVLTPILDSLFVDETLTPPLRVTYFNAAGETQPPGAVSWSGDRPAVASVDPTTGSVRGVGPGTAIVTATARGVTGRALIVVSRGLDIALLLDTLYLMPGDTFTVPVQVLRQIGPAPAPRFEAATQAVFDIDPASGLVTAKEVGGPIPFVAYADTVADTGAVEVRQLNDTSGGAAFVTVLGTIVRRIGSPVRAVNYRRTNGAAAFLLHVTVRSAGVTVENVIVTLPNAVLQPGVFNLDSLSPDEAFGADPICDPPRPWAIWSSPRLELLALSRAGGTIAIAQIDTVDGGLAISGRFAFDARREDLYTDPLATLPLRGSFVAPLVQDNTPCR